MTCILCQAETKDFASQEKVLVQAVHVQRSCVLKRGEGSDEKNTGGSGRERMREGGERKE